MSDSLREQAERLARHIHEDGIANQAFEIEAALREAIRPWREALKRSAEIAGGMTGPGNTIDQCQGYSDACRDIRSALVALYESLASDPEPKP